MRYVWILILVGLMGCSKQATPKQWQTFYTRSADASPLYRAIVPSHWQRQDPPRPIPDTTLPLTTFTTSQGVTLTVYNFPVQKLEETIPPKFQIDRWIQQLHLTEEGGCQITPLSHGGYVGLLLEGEGILAASFELAKEHARVLKDPEKRAAFTLKAVGSPTALKKERQALLTCIHSFELIEDIPQ